MNTEKVAHAKSGWPMLVLVLISYALSMQLWFSEACS